MRVEIVDVKEGDSHYHIKELLIGQTGTLSTKNLWGEGFNSGRFYPDDDSNHYYFLYVKTKPIYDA